jgi:RNA polymerase sigma factor (sigma-70 family)
LCASTVAPRNGALRAYARVPADFGSASDELGERLDSSVSAALLELTHEERNLILLLTWADLTYEQLGDALDLPVGTIRSRVSRVRSKLRERLTPVDTGVEAQGSGLA